MKNGDPQDSVAITPLSREVKLSGAYAFQKMFRHVRLLDDNDTQGH